MANTIANKNYWNFTKGLITEASPLLFPENASIDEANFVLNRDGSRQRRLGIDYEDGYALVDTSVAYTTLSPNALATYKWQGPGGKADITYTCVQVSNTLYLFDSNESAVSASPVDTVTLSSSHLLEPLSFASIQGSLVVASRELGPKLIKPYYSGDTLVNITYESIQIFIRDMYGVEDGHAVDFRPTTLYEDHLYNLLNQGWTETLIYNTFSGVGAYPSNADIWHVAKDSNNDFQSSYLTKTYFGSSSAPKGHYIIDAFNRGAYRTGSYTLAPPPDEVNCYNVTDPEDPLNTRRICTVVQTYPTGVANIPDDIEYGKVGCVAAYSGRIFYSGVVPDLHQGDDRSPNYSGTVFYSKLAESTNDLSKCYTDADPTSEEISDIIASDGGFINILDAYNILALKEFSGALFVFAENGVWSISGTDKGFSAIDNMVKKVSDIGCIAPSSILTVEGGTILYWAQGGIYSISGDDVSGFSVNNITATTIQTLYEEIPNSVKRNVKGVYDVLAKEARWLYTTDSTYNDGIAPYKFNKELILDVVLQAFYTNTMDSSSPYVADYINLTGEVDLTQTNNVVVGTSQVVAGTDTVIVSLNYTGSSETSIKYLTITPNLTGTAKFTFSLFNNTSFLDWETYDGAGKNYESYMITGYELLGDSMRNKSVEYIVFHFNRTETSFVATTDGVDFDNPSSCLVQTRFDFSDSSVSGKWSSEFQAYRLGRFYQPIMAGSDFNYGQSVITTKNKVRGKGRAISYKIRSEEGKDMHLLGWSVQYSGNSSV